MTSDYTHLGKISSTLYSLYVKVCYMQQIPVVVSSVLNIVKLSGSVVVIISLSHGDGVLVVVVVVVGGM